MAIPRGPVRAVLIALVMVLIAALAVVTRPAWAATGYTNPIKSQQGADPWLEYYSGNYYLVTSSSTNTLTMRKSPTLAGLASAPSIQVWQDTTSSRGAAFWTPEIHLFNGHWYLYYSAATVGAACCDTQRTHVLESAGTDPLGPYSYKNQLDDDWLINASVMTIGSSVYLIGSAVTTGTQNLVIATMSNPYTRSGSLRTISTPTYGWEQAGAKVNEGPVALQHGEKTFIVYSASSCKTPDYKLGMLTYTGTDPLSASSWTKTASPVFQRSDANGVYGPGNNSFFTSPDGTENWIVYHANSSTSGGCGNSRTTRAQKFSWNSDGTPNFGIPVATGTSLTAPSGESASTPTAYKLVNRNSGKCLDVNLSSTADGGNVQQWTCNGGNNQRWTFLDNGDDTVRLVNVNSGKVLDVANCSTADGADIRQWAWLNDYCQRFRLVYTATGGWVRIVGYNGKVADVTNCSTADGADIRQWAWLSNNCQQWSIQAA